MVNYSIDLDTGPIVKKLKKIGADMDEINRVILGDIAHEVVTYADFNFLRGQVLKRPSGKLAQSLTYKVYRDYAEVGTNIKYGAIHEFGGTIVPTRARNLAIPIGDMKGSPREHPGLSFTMRGGKKFLEDDNGKLQYVLKSSVQIPPRPYLRPALNDVFASGKAQIIADRELQRQLDKRMR